MSDQTITINEVDYNLNDLNDQAKAHITNIQLVDQKIVLAQQELAILQTARNAYGAALNQALTQKG